MKNLILTLSLVFSQISFGQNLYFPPLTGNQWETIDPQSLGWCTDKLPDLYEHLENANTRALIILKDGKIVVEKYFNQFSRDSFWYWASAGKSLTAFLIGLAQQEGKLKIDELSSKYLGVGWTSCNAPQENKITIRHQLTMTSGLDDISGDKDCTDPACLKCLQDPGTRWAYHNAPYTLLDGILEGSTGQNLNSFLRDKLSLTCGINGLYIKSGYNNVFVSKPRVMARFGLLMLNKGNWNGTSILKDFDYYRDMISSSQDINKSYGYLWWLNGKESYMLPGIQFNFKGYLTPSAPADMYSALGKNGQLLHIVPSMNLVVVRMGDAPDNNLVPIALVDSLWNHLSEIICSPSHNRDLNALNHDLMVSNPVHENLEIRISDSNFDLNITDLSGCSVFKAEQVHTSIHINTSNMASGTYIVCIKLSDRRLIHKKILIVK